MKFKVTYFGYENGSYVQRDKISKIEYKTKQELIDFADLRHAVLSEDEYFEVLSTDIKGNLKKEFSMPSSQHLLVVEPLN